MFLVSVSVGSLVVDTPFMDKSNHLASSNIKTHSSGFLFTDEHVERHANLKLTVTSGRAGLEVDFNLSNLMLFKKVKRKC